MIRTTREKILDLLDIAPMSAPELTREWRLTESTVRWHIRNLRDAKLVRIARWEKSGKQAMPIYGLGNAQDANKPRPLHRLEIHRRYNARHAARIRAQQRKAPATPWDGLRWAA